MHTRRSPLRPGATPRHLAAFVLAAALPIAGCANDQTALPDDADACATPPCETDAGLGGGTSDTALPNDRDALTDAVDRTPDAVPDTDGSRDDVRPDGETPDAEDGSGDPDASDADVDPDAADADAGDAAEREFMDVCRSNADCPVANSTCVRELSWSHTVPGLESGTLSMQELFGVRVPEGFGVCTAPCSSPGDACENLESGAPARPWECQVVGVSAPVHPGVDLEWAPEFPLETPLDPTALSAGQPFVAMCRPAFRTAPLRLQDQCEPCLRDADCGDGFCFDAAEEAGEPLADGAFDGVCAARCAVDTDCPLGFTCDERESGNFCIPIADTCGECLDRDRDGAGIGRCGSRRRTTPVDCDDRDPTAFYAGETGPADPDRCEPNRDVNCNGIGDDIELVGPGIWGARHCRACGDVCDESVISADVGANGAIVCADDISGAPTCAADCAPGWGDCNGLLSDGCETSLITDDHCGSCGAACISTDPTVPALACAGTIDTTVQCVIAECAEGRADCNEVFGDGCEVDVTVDVRNCGTCGADCTDRLPNAFESCEGGQCNIDSCDATFGNCNSLIADGCETNTETSVNHCGACGNRCRFTNGVADCVDGACVLAACNAGFADCDGNAANGCEVNLNTSTSHCGTCGNVCSVPGGVPECRSGVCGLARCSSGFADCNASPGCETDITRIPNCGGCGITCAEIPEELHFCDETGTRPTWTCACDTTRTRQYCNGQYSVCGQDVDEGCPRTLSGFTGFVTSAWTAFQIPISPAAVVDQTEPPVSPITFYRYLYGFEVKLDNFALIQLRPLWLNPVDLVGRGVVVTPTSNYLQYRTAAPMSDYVVNSLTVLGVPDANIDAVTLRRTTSRGFREGLRVFCDILDEPGNTIILPVAIQLYSLDGMDNNISRIELVCQRFSVELTNAGATDPLARYTLQPIGLREQTNFGFGRGLNLLATIPTLATGSLGAPILRIEADVDFTSWPQLSSGGALSTNASVFRAMRVATARTWGITP